MPIRNLDAVNLDVVNLDVVNLDIMFVSGSLNKIPACVLQEVNADARVPGTANA